MRILQVDVEKKYLRSFKQKVCFIILGIRNTFKIYFEHWNRKHQKKKKKMCLIQIRELNCGSGTTFSYQ